MTTEPTGLSGGALQARIDELWDFKDPAASESRFRGAVGDASTMSEQDILMTQVARALGLQGQYAEGLRSSIPFGLMGTMTSKSRRAHASNGAGSSTRAATVTRRGRGSRPRSIARPAPDWRTSQWTRCT